MVQKVQLRQTWWRFKGDIFMRCPCCKGSQYRRYHFEVTKSNPSGAKCIFCKSNMMLA
ncbi:TPA: hypothetical protein ACS705_000899 [Providencia alcalifaciens]